MSDYTVAEAARAAYAAGLTPIRARTDGTKAPLGTWRQHMERRPDELIVDTWFLSHPNVGLVCGGEGRLECLEFEGRMMPRLGEISQALAEAGLADDFTQWLRGYFEETPGGGCHILVRLDGDGPLPGNTKIAMSSAGETLIETRGEGGFVVVAPSGGPTHLSGRPWVLQRGGFDSICWTTRETWDAVIDCLGQFDEAPPSPDPAPPAPTRLRLVGDGWVDQALADLPPLGQVLEERGWSYVRTEPRGQLWRRPGKDHGHSARINSSGRLHIFTSSCPLPAGRTTFDALDVIYAYDHGHAPSAAERVALLKELSPRQKGDVAGGSSSIKESHLTVTEELYLPDEFWSSRPDLARIREAALNRMLSPDGVLGAFLSLYATTIPMGIRLPPIVGAWAPLNVFNVLVSKSGGGKTSAIAVATELLGPTHNPHLIFRSLRSGEGLINLAVKPAPRRTKGDDVTQDDGPSYNQGVHVTFDEGGALGKQTERSGSTTIPYLNTAWAGHGSVGGAKASEDGYFPADLVRVCALIGVQFGAAANLFTGEAEIMGFPQRLCFYGLDHPALMQLDVRKLDYAPIERLDVPLWSHGEYAGTPLHIEVPDLVVQEVRLWTQSKHGEDAPSHLDGHMMNLRLRNAAILALMDGRGVMNEADWELASQIEHTSRNIRSKMVAALGDLSKARAQALGAQDALRKISEGDIYLDRAAQSIGQKVIQTKRTFTSREVKDHLASWRRRHGVDWKQAVALAATYGYLLLHDDGSVGPCG